MRVLVGDSAAGEHREMFDIGGALDRLTEVSEDHLRKQLREFLESLSNVISDLPDTCGPFDLTEFQVLLQVSASGGVELVGKVGAGVCGGITIRLTRREA